MKKKLIPFCLLVILIAACFSLALLLPKVALGLVLFLLLVNIVLTMDKTPTGHGRS